MTTLFKHKKGGVAEGTSANPLTNLIQSVRRQAANASGNGFVSPEMGSRMVSLESADASDVASLMSAAKDLTVSLESAISVVASGMAQGTKASTLFSSIQKDAGVAAGLLGSAMAEYLRQPILRGGNIPEGTEFIVPSGADMSMDRFKPALESFDEKENESAVVYSVAYNMSAARQDEFGETFFPTVIVTPDQVGFSVSIRIHNVMADVRRSIDGEVNKFKKRNIIQAVIDPSIFNADNTKVVPVYRDESKKFMLDEALIQPEEVAVGEFVVSTNPLKVGKKFSLIGISQTEETLDTGLMDTTDALDSAVTLKNIYVQIGTGSNKSLIRFSTARTPFSVWNRAPQGNYRQLSLNYTNSTLQITKDIKDVFGAELKGLTDAILTDYQVRVGVSVFGNLNQELGDCEVTAGGVELVSVIGKDGKALEADDPIYVAIATALGEPAVLGYDLEAQRVNTNRRQRGQLLDTTYYNQIYAVPLRSPLTILRPTTITDETDAADLGALITATHIRTSNEAVRTLFEASKMLEEHVDPRNTFDQAPAILGVARDLVKATFIKKALDVRNFIQSLTSADRFENIQNALVNVIRDYVYNVYRDSNYQAAANALAGGIGQTPTVIIGTDPVIARYLMVTGDTRLLGPAFDVKVVQTLNQEMKGKMFITFGDFSTGKEGVPNPMHFGNMAWKPEMTLILPILRNGAYTKELTVQPSFLHIVNLPILMHFDIAGITEVATGLVDVPVNATVSGEITTTEAP